MTRERPHTLEELLELREQLPRFSIFYQANHRFPVYHFRAPIRKVASLDV